jgi:two-component system nitrogen regulation sensor histidine kinase NtrY
MIGRSLRGKLVVLFLAATLVPLALTVWTSIELLNQSLNLTPVRELDTLSRSFERVSREYYQRTRDWLKDDARSGRSQAKLFAESDRDEWPPAVQEFWDSGADERFNAAGPDGRVLQYLERSPKGVRVYSRALGLGMRELTREFTSARDVLDATRKRDLRRGFVYTFVAVASAVWIAGLVALIYFARRITAPVHRLTQALRAVGAGELSARVEGEARDDEIGSAIEAFNRMANQLQESRVKLIHMTRLESWQALARKMAHEVKNSLTPIRLTMEEISARSAGPDAEFLRQASQIVVDEVTSLEKRVRAFSQFAAEPPVCLEPVEMNSLVEDRVSFLRAAHPEVSYTLDLSPGPLAATADRDLVKGVITNLLQNAAEAAQAGGEVLLKTAVRGRTLLVEVHDSGPGLSPEARGTVFEPTISFKKGGMGLGLSIARKSALLCGGDIAVIDGALGGAGFRVSLAAFVEHSQATPERSTAGAMLIR